jgi:hypothetical protein
MPTTTLFLLTLLGCGSGGDGERGNSSRFEPVEAKRKSSKGKSDGKAKAPAGKSKTAGKAPTTAGSTGNRTAEGEAMTVVLVVEDTVRADHMHLCGYERPNTPFLEYLLDNPKASHTCSAYTSGTWTLPSHASFFTGLAPTEHYVLHMGYPLADDARTMAEIFKERGFQTAAISGNPTLAEASGLMQGFDHIVVPKNLHAALRAKELSGEVARILGKLDNSKPLFLFVNVFDAHDPYPAVPGGLDWIDKQDGVDINPNGAPSDAPVFRYTDGRMPPQEAKRFIERIVDTYDYGIYEADTSLRRVAKLLKDGGWLARPHRVVITSDHGEHLGHHQLVRHDGPPWEGVVRVPLAVLDTSRETPPDLSSPVSATATYWLTLTGELPGEPLPVASYSVAYNEGSAIRKDAVAIWDGPDRKAMWVEGTKTLYDVSADPFEASGTALATGDSLHAPLDAGVEALKASRKVAFAEKDDDMMKLLEDIGYVE